MHLKLKALAGDVPVEITVKPDPCDRQLDRHSVVLAVGDSDSGTLMAHMDSWWAMTAGRAGLCQALAENAARCSAKETGEIAAVARVLTDAARVVAARLYIDIEDADRFRIPPSLPQLVIENLNAGTFVIGPDVRAMKDTLKSRFGGEQ